ncbi:TPA: sensor histidine kinase [Clostridioides difficile]|nr:sensor histidine kinase [Clostridioides difficile]
MELIILSDILSLCVITAESFCCFILMNIFLVFKNRFHSKIMYYAAILYLITAAFLISNMTKGSLKIILLILIYLSITLFFYTGKLWKRIIIPFGIHSLIIFTDIISLQLLFYFTSMDSNYIRESPLGFFLTAIFSKTCLFIIVITLKNIAVIFYSPELKYFSKYNWFIYLLQSISSIIVLLSLIKLTYKLGIVPLVTIVAALSILYINETIFGILEKSCKFSVNEHNAALYRQQSQTNLDNLLVLSEALNNQNAFLHDYKQHLSVISQLLYEKKYDQVQELLSSISNECYVTLYRFKTNNQIIDAILNQKFIQASNKNVILDVRATDLSQVNIDAYYLITIMSNAIDNAIEASQKVGIQQIVSIKLSIEQYLFIFSVINPTEEPVVIIENNIKTTKDDKLIHGNGLKNIALALQKCDGDYELGYENGYFQFTAFIRLENKM